MSVTIVGAGSAGLSTAILMKSRLGADIRIVESAAEGETPGLGIALLPFALNHLSAMNLAGFSEFAETCIPIDRVTRVFADPGPDAPLVRQTRTQAQDVQYWGVKRSRLLDLLSEGARHAGVPIDYGRTMSEDEVRAAVETADLLIGADGAGSVVRNAFADAFGIAAESARSRFAWLELEGTLDHFLFGYASVAGQGMIRLTAYPHGAGECSAIVTHSAGLTDMLDRPEMLDPDGMISPAGMATINEIFARGLEGRRLAGRSRWRRYRATRCRNAAAGKVALVGDAYATAFYETGWGTSAALQESMILAQAIVKTSSREEAFALYNRKSAEISLGVADAALRTMREIDAQSDRLKALGAEAFLDTFPA